MTVTDVQFVSSECDASTEGGRIWTDVYRVIHDVRDNNPLDSINAPGVPVDYEVHPNDQWATCRSKVCRYEAIDRNFAMVRLVTCTYRTKADEEDPNEQDDPLNWAAKWSGSFQQYQIETNYDINGDAILNSAGYAYPIAPVKDQSRPVLQCQKNFASMDLAAWWAFRDKINNAAWGGLPAKTVKVSNIQFAEQWNTSTTPYYSTTWTFMINFKKDPNNTPPSGEIGWQMDAINQGFHYLTTPGDVSTDEPILDSTGQPIVTAKTLKSDGTQAATKAEASYGIFDIYEELDFSTLPIPAPLIKS